MRQGLQTALHVLRQEKERGKEGMMKPTIHSNGTSRQELLDQVCNAGHAIQDAMTALAKATPNGRDYYVQDPGAIKIALEEHNSQATRLQSVLDELQELAIHISDTEE